MSSMDEANKTALDTLYSKYGNWLYKWLLRRLGSSDLAEDLVQTTFLALAERPHLDKIKHPSAYLFKICSNQIINHWRRIEKEKLETITQEMEDTFADEQAHPEQELLSAIDMECLQQAIARLPRMTRDVFIICHMDGRTHKETACYLGISASSVQKHLALALARITRRRSVLFLVS